MCNLSMPITVRPYDHQRRAFEFVCGLYGLKDGHISSSGAALLLEMGCGKTLVSPSTQMAWIGEMLVKGLTNSIDDNGGKAVRAATGLASDINGVMRGLAEDMNTALPSSVDLSATTDPGSGRAAVGSGNVSLTGNNFYIRDEQDIRTLAIEIAALTKRQQIGAGLRFA